MRNSFLKDLKELYNSIKEKILNRIAEFKEVWEKKDREKFLLELMFCLLTPQSKAKYCWEAVENLKKANLVYKGSADDIKGYLIKIRFKNKKTMYIVEARKKFEEVFNALLDDKNVIQKREWIVKNIKGLGYKEASHFLRNIGLGEDISILDRHILKNLLFFKVIDQIPLSMSKKKYLEIETKMKRFSYEIKIPMEHLDLLFWYKATGEIFK